MSRAVEVLHIIKNHPYNSHCIALWLKNCVCHHISNQCSPLLIDDKFYITVEFNKLDADQSQSDMAKSCLNASSPIGSYLCQW